MQLGGCWFKVLHLDYVKFYHRLVCHGLSWIALKSESTYFSRPALTMAMYQWNIHKEIAFSTFCSSNKITSIITIQQLRSRGYFQQHYLLPLRVILGNRSWNFWVLWVSVRRCLCQIPKHLQLFQIFGANQQLGGPDCTMDIIVIIAPPLMFLNPGNYQA